PERVATSGGAAAIAALVTLGPLGLTRWLRRYALDVDCVQVPVRHGRVPVATPDFVRRCHAAGLPVHVWVVDEPAEIERLLDLGVDGIMTDRADVLAEVYARRGLWPQR
ncbi:glycerophosphodiester phosphodiesterase family protein, partial [Micrococcus luteus]